MNMPCFNQNCKYQNLAEVVGVVLQAAYLQHLAAIANDGGGKAWTQIDPMDRFMEGLALIKKLYTDI